MNFYDVILAGKLQDMTYPANFFDLLFARKLYPADVWEIYEGTLPATFNANGDDMRQYQIYGNTGGVGDRTVNLLDNRNIESDKYVNSSGVKGTDSRWDIYYVVATNGEQYTATGVSTISSGAYIGYADENKNILGVVGTALDATPQTVTMPETGVFLAVPVRKSATTPMLTPGTTPPETYVPFGYEVDMGTYENIWKQNVEQGGIMATGDTSDSRLRVRSFISVEEGQQYKIEINEKIRVLYAFYDNNGTLSKISGIYNGTGTISEYTFTVPTGANVIGVSMQKSDNTDILPSEITTKICKKLPATTTPIYIGDSALQKDEYIDYEAQKVFRRTAQIMPSAPAETKTLNGITVTCDGEGRYSISGTATATARIKFNVEDFTIPVSVGQGGSGTFSLFNTVLNATFRLIYNDTTVDEWSCSSLNRTSTAYSAMGNKKINAISFNVGTGTTLNGVISPMFTDNGTLPETYIPYIQPTDPPVPLPALPTCEGTTIVDYAGQSVAVPEKGLFEYKGGT